MPTTITLFEEEGSRHATEAGKLAASFNDIPTSYLTANSSQLLQI